MNRKAFYLDMLERTAWTFVQAAMAVLIVEQSFDIAILKVALVAGGLAVLKAIAASQVGNPDAATLPK